MMNWDDLKIFLAVAEAPSMRHAAKALKISHSTVSRRIDALEEALKVRLFDRKPSGYALTDAGQELMPIALATDDRLHAFERSVAGRDNALEGEVCITMPDAIAVEFFMPIFADFMTQYPAIRLRIDDSFEMFDLSRREADVAIRFTDNPPDHLIGRKLGTMKQAVYASRAYLASNDPYAVGSTARWVGWGQPMERPSWLDHTPFPDLDVACHFDNVLIQLAAVRQGAGLGYLPCVMGDRDPSLRRLSDPAGPSFDAWLLSHRDLRAAARMRVFRKFVTDRIDDISKALEGRSDQGA